MRTLCLAFLTLAFIALGADEPKPKPIPAGRAGSHEGERCTVYLTVRHTAWNRDATAIHLHSIPEWQKPECFWVVLTPEAVEAYVNLGVKDPAKHLEGKRVRVTGTIERAGVDGSKSPAVFVKDPAVIEISPKDLE